MTEIIEVHPDATAEAVRGQVARAGTERLALALPDDWAEFEHIARLRLLQRQAQIQHRQVALITRHLPTHRTAQQLGIPVFVSEQELSGRAHWQMAAAPSPLDPRRPAQNLPDPPPWRQADVVRQTARPSLHRSRQRRIQAEQAYRRPTPLWLRVFGYALAGLCIAVMLGGFGLFVLPAATVTVVPGQETALVRVALEANPGQVLDLAAGELPARLVETRIEASGAISTTGRAQRPAERAVGTVSFSNLDNQAVTIPAGTLLSTSTGTSVSFRTVAPAELPGPAGNRVNVAIEAVEPGAGGNVRENTIATVDGPLRFQVRVTNPNATGRGSSSLVPVVTQEDRDALLESVYAQAEAEAHARLQAQLPPGEWLIPESVQTYRMAQFFDHFNDEPADSLSLTLRVLAQGAAVDEGLARQAGMQALEASVPTRGKLVAESIAIYREPAVSVDGATALFTVTAQGNYVIPIDPVEVRAAVAGRAPDEAAQALQETWVLARPPEFHRDPAWLPTLPVLSSRIQVRVEYAVDGNAP